MKNNAFIAYFNERFPLANCLLFCILYSTVASVAYPTVFSSSFLTHLGIIDLLGFLAIISFFFRLRVFDEWKDYAIDAINHPQRVLQSGRVSLKQLTILSVVASVVEIAWCLLIGRITFIVWLIAFTYSLLMRYEFFIGNYLKTRLIVYAISHLLIMPFIIWWIWAAYTGTFLPMHPAFLYLAGLSLLAGFAFELARKIHSPAEERPLVDSYSKVMGFIPAIVAVCITLLLGVLTQFYFLSTFAAASYTYLVIGLLYLGTIGTYYYCQKHRQEQKLRLAEKLVSLFMLLSYVFIIIELNS